MFKLKRQFHYRRNYISFLLQLYLIGNNEEKKRSGNTFSVCDRFPFLDNQIYKLEIMVPYPFLEILRYAFFLPEKFFKFLFLDPRGRLLNCDFF